MNEALRITYQLFGPSHPDTIKMKFILSQIVDFIRLETELII